MIEVLVASAILVVIVMMLSMLFQQTSIAWRTGQLRAQGAMRLRSYIGAIQRDASVAIDAKKLPKELLCTQDAISPDGRQMFEPDDILFYTMTGGADTFPLKRSLSFIHFTSAGKRKKYELSENKIWSLVEETTVVDFLVDGSSDENKAVETKSFFFEWPDVKDYDADGKVITENKYRLPLYMTVNARLIQKGKLYDVGAASSGPDGKPGDDFEKSPGKDDIRTWVQ